MDPPLDAPQALARHMIIGRHAEEVEQIRRGNSEIVPDLDVALPSTHSNFSATCSGGYKDE